MSLQSSIQPICQFSKKHSVLIIDSQVDNYQQLVDGALPEVEVFVLNADRDGITQITQIVSSLCLPSHASLSLRLVSHGSPGCLYLGISQLSLDTLGRYAEQIQGWFPPVSELLLYGCNVAVGDAGQEFLAKLHALTQASIHASTQVMGSCQRGGTWQFDYAIAQFQSPNPPDTTALPWATSVLTEYTGVFNNPPTSGAANAPITISGTPEEDNTLIADISALADADGLPDSSTYIYQWQQFNGSTWNNIAGATNNIFTPGDAQAGQDIRVQMSYTDLQGTAETVVSAEVTVANVNDSPTSKILDILPLDVDDYYTPEPVYGVDISGSYAYLVSGASGLQIINLSNPTAPIYTYDTSGTALGIDVVGNYAYVADGATGLQILDIRDPTAISLLGAYDTPGTALDVIIVDDYAYILDGLSGLQILDISNPSAPSLVGAYDTPGTASGISVVGDYAYIADGTSGLQIFDISDPTAVSLVGTYDTPGTALNVSIFGNYAYVADGTSGLQIINISNPSVPSFVGTYNTAQADDVSIAGTFAYVANNPSLELVDINNPSAPFSNGSIGLLGEVVDVSIVDNYIYVAFSDSSFGGLQAINLGADRGIQPIAISGDPYENQTLTAATGGLSDADGLPDSSTYIYQWQQFDGSTWNDIVGATSRTFVPGEAQAGQAVRVQMTYTDLQGTTETVTSKRVVINDLNNAPTIGLANDSASIAENSRGIVQDVNAFDADGDTVTFAIASGADSALFTIDRKTGELSFISSAPDFETPIDANADNVYEVVVTANDGYKDNYGYGQVTSQTVFITVTNVNEAPEFLVESVTVREGLTTVSAAVADDVDGDPLTFSISGGSDSGFFAIDPTTGVLSFNTAPDFDDPLDAGTDNVYEVEVTADDGNGESASQLISVTVEDVNHVTDFNADGLIDIVWRRASTGETSIWFTDGESKIGGGSVGNTIRDPNWVTVGVGDFDHDGDRDDVLWQNRVNGRNTVWFMDGINRVGTVTIASAGNTNWQIQGVGDFDHSTYTDDILWHNRVTGKTIVWTMAETTKTGVIDFGTVSLDWRIQGIGDFDGSGFIDDPVWRNYANSGPNSGVTRAWLTDGQTKAAGYGFNITVPLNWEVEGVSDLDGDGSVDDLLWYNETNYSAASWFIDNGVKMGGSGVQSAGAGWDAVI